VLRHASFGLHFILGQSRLAYASRLAQTLGIAVAALMLRQSSPNKRA
jgi:hypothetical protein